MILADKIIQSRKQLGWSQEDLADKMGVSRQSVSKWESANSIPDLNKIIKLADIFTVSTDYLLKDEIETVDVIGEDREEGIIKVSLEQATDYIQGQIKASKRVAMGVLLCILSTVPLFTLLGVSERGAITENMATALGLVLLLLGVAVAVILFISVDSYKTHVDMIENKEFELQYGVRGIVKERADLYKRTYTYKVAVSVALFIMSPLPLIVAGIFTNEDWFLLMMLDILVIMVAVGVFNIIPTSMKYGAMQRVLGEGEFAPSRRETAKVSEKVGSVYWPIVVAIYLGWSFWTMNWGVTWIIWPVAGVLFAGVVGLVNLLKKD